MTFYFTIGTKYAREPHPLGWHPNGYVEVKADNEEQARLYVSGLCGAKWAFCYDKEPTKIFFPKGCTHKYDAPLP